MNESEIQQLMAQMKAESPDLPNQEIYNFLHANNFGSDADRYKHLFGDIKTRTEDTSVAAANNTFGTLAKDFIQTVKDNPEYSIPAAFLGGYAANKALPQVGEAISSGISSLKNRFLSNSNKGNIVSSVADAPTVPNSIAQAQTDTDLNTYIANSEKAKADKIRYAQEQEAIRAARFNNQPAAPVSVSEAITNGQNPTQALNKNLAKEIDAATPKTTTLASSESAIKVEGLVRDAQGNFQYPQGMSPAAIQAHKAFVQQYPEIAASLEAQGKFGMVGGGAADNSLHNTYGPDLRKTILNEVNPGQMAGINKNYLEKINPAIKALSTETGLGKTLAELKVNNPKGGIKGPLGVPATIGNSGELVSAPPGKVSGLVNKGGKALLLMAMADAAKAAQEGNTAPAKEVGFDLGTGALLSTLFGGPAGAALSLAFGSSSLNAGEEKELAKRRASRGIAPPNQR